MDHTIVIWSLNEAVKASMEQSEGHSQSGDFTTTVVDSQNAFKTDKIHNNYVDRWAYWYLLTLSISLNNIFHPQHNLARRRLVDFKIKWWWHRLVETWRHDERTHEYSIGHGHKNPQLSGAWWQKSFLVRANGSHKWQKISRNRQPFRKDTSVEIRRNNDRYLQILDFSPKRNAGYAHGQFLARRTNLDRRMPRWKNHSFWLKRGNIITVRCINR